MRDRPGARHLPRPRQGETPPGNSPGSEWVAFNAIAERLDYGRRYTTRTNQVQRSFEDTSLKQRVLELVMTALALGRTVEPETGMGIRAWLGCPRLGRFVGLAFREAGMRGFGPRASASCPCSSAASGVHRHGHAIPTRASTSSQAAFFVPGVDPARLVAGRAPDTQVRGTICLIDGWGISASRGNTWIFDQCGSSITTRGAGMRGPLRPEPPRTRRRSSPSPARRSRPAGSNGPAACARRAQRPRSGPREASKNARRAPRRPAAPIE